MANSSAHHAMVYDHDIFGLLLLPRDSKPIFLTLEKT